ncbi:hypothetical protein BGZ79_006380, partial [Entomortierella chlamydospora]
WYLGLAYVDGILERQGYSAFEAFVLHSKFNSNEYFLQGICLRLEQIAATQQIDISNGAIEFLQGLATSPAKAVQRTAQDALKRLDIAGKASPHSKDTTSGHLVPQCLRDDLPPIWDPIWLKTESKLLKAVQERYTPQVSREDVQSALKAYYARYLSILRVSGDDLDMETCFVNLAI